MLEKCKQDFQNYEWFWKAKYYWKWALLKFFQTRLRAHSKTQEKTQKNLTLLAIIKICIPKLLYAFLLYATLFNLGNLSLKNLKIIYTENIHSFFSPEANPSGVLQSDTSAPQKKILILSQKGTKSRTEENKIESINPKHEPTKEIGRKNSKSIFYTELLAAIIAFNGVIIGLYYNSIVSAASAIYSKAPGNIRNLLAYENISNIYINFLATFTFFCVICLSSNYMGFHPPDYFLPIITFFSGVGIISFVKLGSRAFDFFDPAELSIPIFKNLHKQITRVTVDSKIWKYTEFQTRVKASANNELNKLDSLITFIEAQKDIKSDSLQTLSTAIVALLETYQKGKLRIPPSSKWFKNQAEHPNWYLTQDQEIQTAHINGTRLQFKETFDYQWFEKSLVSTTCNCFRLLLKENALEEARVLTCYFAHYLENRSQIGEIKHSFEFAHLTLETFLESYHEKINSAERSTQTSLLDLSDYILNLPIHILLAYKRNLQRTLAQPINTVVSRINWDNDKSLYQSELPLLALSKIEYLYENLFVEQKAEGKRITPDTYISDIVSCAYHNLISQDLKILGEKEGWLFYKDHTEKLEQGTNNELLRSNSISKSWEYLNKLECNATSFNAYLNSLSKDLTFTSLAPSPFELEHLCQVLDQEQGNICEKMASLIPDLCENQGSSDLPDFKGQFLHTIGEILFSTILENNKKEKFPLLLKAYFSGIFDEHRKIFEMNRFKTFTDEDRFIIAFSPIVDIIELSSYAYLFSLFYSDFFFWSPIKKCWDDLLTPPERESYLIALCNGIEVFRRRFAIKSRDLLRTTWKMKAEKKLRQLSSEKVHLHNFYEYRLIDHKSPLVRYFARASADLVAPDIQQIFVCLYLFKEFPQTIEHFSNRFYGLDESIDHEEKNFKKLKEEKDA